MSVCKQDRWGQLDDLVLRWQSCGGSREGRCAVTRTTVVTAVKVMACNRTDVVGF